MLNVSPLVFGSRFGNRGGFFSLFFAHLKTVFYIFRQCENGCLVFVFSHMKIGA